LSSPVPVFQHLVEQESPVPGVLRRVAVMQLAAVGEACDPGRDTPSRRAACVVGQLDREALAVLVHVPSIGNRRSLVDPGQRRLSSGLPESSGE